MSKPIKTAIKELHKEVKLSTDDLEYFHRADDEYSDSQKGKAQTRWFLSRRTYLSAAISGFFLGGIIWLALSNIVPSTSKTERIFADIVDNHLSYKSLKYNTSSIWELADKFSYLGFMLSDSRSMMSINGKLTGARPCLILNIPAVQLRYQSDNNLWTTVYQTRYEKGIHGLIPDMSKQQKPLTVIKSGVQVALWQKDGLLFATAE